MFKCLIFATTLLVSSYGLLAQVRVTKVMDAEMLSGKNGIVYNLPRTQIHVDLRIIKTQSIAGPLAEYARDYLGLDDVITKNSVGFEIGDVALYTTAEPDPEQVYIIEKEEKASGEIWISFGKSTPFITLEKFENEMAPEGFTTWSDKLFITPEPGKIFRKYTDSPTREVIDTLIRRVSIDTLVLEQKVYKRSMVEFTDQEKAQEAAGKIRQIEQDKYNLLIGYQETAYSRETIEYMYLMLEEQRLEYLELFTGVSMIETLKFDYLVFPDLKIENQEYVLAGFSKSTGMAAVEGQNGILLTFIPDAGILIPGDAAKNQSATGLVYRIPQHGSAMVSFQGKELVSKRVEVLQLGSILTLPPSFKRVEFDFETGALRSVVLE